MPLNSDFKRKVSSLLRRFKLSEVVPLLSLVFPTISVANLSQLLKRLRLPLNPRSVAEVILHLYEQEAPCIDDCDKKLCLIYLLDAALHTHHKWGIAQMKNEVSEIPDKLSDLNKVITRAYRSKALNANVHSILYGSVIWTVVVERVILKKGGVKLGPPHFFAFTPDLDVLHVLFSPKSMDRDLHLQIYAESLGYGEYEMMNFEGNNVTKVLDCIQRQDSEERTLAEIPQFQPGGGEVVVRSGGWKDYSQALDRKAFAEKVFSTRSIHKYITVECEELCIKQQSNTSTIKEFYSTMSFRTANSNQTVEDIFKQLVTMDTVHFPLPSYMMSIKSTLSKTICTQSDNSLYR